MLGLILYSYLLGIFCHAHLVDNLASGAVLIRETCQINNISIVYILASESSFWRRYTVLENWRRKFGIDKPGCMVDGLNEVMEEKVWDRQT